jgi:hypothetical protein
LDAPILPLFLLPIGDLFPDAARHRITLATNIGGKAEKERPVLNATHVAARLAFYLCQKPDLCDN